MEQSSKQIKLHDQTEKREKEKDNEKESEYDQGEKNQSDY